MRRAVCGSDVWELGSGKGPGTVEGSDERSALALALPNWRVVERFTVQFNKNTNPPTPFLCSGLGRHGLRFHGRVVSRARSQRELAIFTRLIQHPSRTDPPNVV